MRAIVVCIGLAFSSGGTTAELTRNDFAYGAQLQTQSPAAAYEFTLPLAVFKQTAFADLRDIRIFNSDDQAVPFSLQQPPPPMAAKKSVITLPIFPLRGDVEKTLRSLRVNIVGEQGDISVRLPSSSEARASAPITAYLVDAREQKQPVGALELQWKSLAKNFSIALTVQASDDLSTWRTIRSDAPIINIEYNGQQLREHRAEFAATQAKFFRLSWRSTSADSAEPAELSSVHAEIMQGVPEAERESLTANGARATSEVQDAIEVQYNVGVHAPIDRVNLLLPELNSAVAAQIYSRATLTANDTATPWRFVGTQMFYRLQRESQEAHSRPLQIAPNNDRYWAIRFDAKANAIGATLPSLQVAWLPQRVVFLARGNTPFWLAFGNASASSAQSSLPTIVSTTTALNAAGETIHPALAQVLNVVEVGGSARLHVERHINWKTIALWVSLSVGVALLAWMAMRLMRDLNSANTKGS